MKTHKSALVYAWILIFGLSLNTASAQIAGISIESDDLLTEDGALVAKATVLKQAGKLLSLKQVKVALKFPTPAPLLLPAPLTDRLEPRVLAERGRKALVRIGWFYLEKASHQWHVNLADAYAITVDGAVATCHHCVALEEHEEREMTEGFLIAADTLGNVLPVTALLARDLKMDTAIVRVEGGNFTPLALNDQTAPGDTVYVYSDPMSAVGYFSSGLLNRFFWLDGKASSQVTSIEGARNLRIHVSADWAPGSSGAAMMDVCGNVIGHVSVIDPLVSDEPLPVEKAVVKPGKKSLKISPPPADHRVLMILHEAISARGVRLLAESMNAATPAAVRSQNQN